MADSRTKNTERNIVWGAANKILLALLPFVIRTIIIKEIGVEYVGINSLFTAVLNVLSLSELGFNSSVIFVMYRGIANNDKIQLSALLGFLKRVYLIIGIFISLIGLLTIPFLDTLIHDADRLPSDINIYLIYLIFLANSVIGYCWGAYRNSLFCAYQRNDIISNIGSGTSLIFSIIQIVLLIAFKNYYVYVLIIPLITLSQNYLYVKLSKKMFPSIVPYGKLTESDKKELKKLVAGTFMGRLGAVLSVSIDNIVISAFLGVTILGYYSNYFYVISTIQGFMVLVYTSMQGALGNSVIVDSLEKNTEDLRNFTFIYNWIIGVCTFCLVFLLQPFILLWIGEEGMLPNVIVYLLCFYFFVTQSFGILGTYKQALGIVWEDRYRPLIGGLVNIGIKVLLILWLQKYGDTYSLIGVLVSTIIAHTLVNTPWSVHVTFKRYFKIGELRYYISIFYYFFVTIIACILCVPFFGIIPIDTGIHSLFYLTLRFVCAIILSNLLFYFVYFKSARFKVAKKYVLSRFHFFKY